MEHGANLNDLTKRAHLNNERVIVGSAHKENNIMKKALLLLTAALLSSSAATAATVTVGYSDSSTGGVFVPLYSAGESLHTVVNTFMGSFGVGASSTVAFPFGNLTSYEFAVNDVFATKEDTVRLYGIWAGLITPVSQLIIPTLFQANEAEVAGFSLSTQLYINDTLLGTQIFPNAAPATFFPIFNATTGLSYTLTEVFTISCSAACAAAGILGDVGGAIVATPMPVAPVPLPAAVWLFGSALAGLGLLGRRQWR